MLIYGLYISKSEKSNQDKAIYSHLKLPSQFRFVSHFEAYLTSHKGYKLSLDLQIVVGFI